MAMYRCIEKCLCAKCEAIKLNCAECETSVDKTKECLSGGIKECKKFKKEDKQ